jgi:hypothetical protein
LFPHVFWEDSGISGVFSGISGVFGGFRENVPPLNHSQIHKTLLYLTDSSVELFRELQLFQMQKKICPKWQNIVRP